MIEINVKDRSQMRDVRRADHNEKRIRPIANDRWRDNNFFVFKKD